MKKVLYFLLAVMLFISCTTDNLSGTISDTDTGKEAMVYNADLTPAIGAVVRFFEINDTSRTPVLETKTDTNGNYTFAGLKQGTYNIITKKDSSLAFLDSVFISSTVNTIIPDTLGNAGTISGVVRVQLNHDPRTVTVQVLGTDNYSNVDSNGKFILQPLAKGDYHLRLVTQLPDYSPTFLSIKSKGKNDTLKDTINVIYTGIPIVTGLNAIYDTLTGVIHVSWNKTSYRDIQDYLIFRDYNDSITMTNSPIAAVDDTILTDTIFHKNVQEGKFSFKDTVSYHFKYRVCIQNNSLKRGDFYRYVHVLAVPPSLVKTRFMTTAYQIQKGIASDTCSINDTVKYISMIVNPNRQIQSLVYTDLSSNVIIKSKMIDSVKSIADTVLYSWSDTGIKKIEIAAIDIAGVSWRDTIVQYVVKDLPDAKIASDSVVLNVPTKISATVSDKYGKVIKCEWKFGNSSGDFISTSTINPETTITIRDSLLPYLPCVLRVTDDDGNQYNDSIQLKIAIKWENVTLPADMKNLTNLISFKNKLFFFTSDGDCKKIWISEDGTNWQIQNTEHAWTASRYNPVVCNDKMYVMEYNEEIEKSKLWSTADGINWDSANIDFTVADRYNFFGSFQQKLIYGYNGNFYSSQNGTEWVHEDANNGFQLQANTDVSYVVKNDSLFYTSTYFYDLKNDDYTVILVGVKSSWNDDEMISIFHQGNNHSSNHSYPIFNYMNKVCLIIPAGAPFPNAGNLVFLGNEGKWYTCSGLPSSYDGKQGIVFKNKIYIFNSNSVWVSK